MQHTASLSKNLGGQSNNGNAVVMQDATGPQVVAGLEANVVRDFSFFGIIDATGAAVQSITSTAKSLPQNRPNSSTRRIDSSMSSEVSDAIDHAADDIGIDSVVLSPPLPSLTQLQIFEHSLGAGC